jgi:pimeloyl-ACP methyl ester carboxylesterase
VRPTDRAPARGGDRAPAWFQEAVRARPDRIETVVEGCTIQASAWGEPDRPPLVLVHGGAAHAGWWTFLAPAFLPERRVVVLDLSGHGDSGHRERYAFPTWAEEVLAVARAASTGPPVLVGHSMGGIIAALAAATPGADVAGIVAVDAPLHEPLPEHVDDAEVIFQRPKRYGDEAEGLRRFRVLPEQPVLHTALLEHAAARSLRPDGSGWTWKFDPDVFSRPALDRPPDVGVILDGLGCPSAAIVASASPVVPEADRRRLRRAASEDPRRHYVELAGGHHHLMFDQPLELVTAIRTLLARWG